MEVLALPKGSHKSTCLEWCVKFDGKIKHFGAAIAENALETDDDIKTAHTNRAPHKLGGKQEMESSTDGESEVKELRKAFETMLTADGEHEKLRKAFDERPSIDA